MKNPLPTQTQQKQQEFIHTDPTSKSKTELTMKISSSSIWRLKINNITVQDRPFFSTLQQGAETISSYSLLLHHPQHNTSNSQVVIINRIKEVWDWDWDLV